MEGLTLEEVKAKLQEALDANVTLKGENETLKASEKKLTDQVATLEEEKTALKKEVSTLLKKPENQNETNGVGKTFDYKAGTPEQNGKYKVLVPAIRIPGIGRRTALEILADDVAQKKLVDSKSGAIQKLVD